MHSFFGLQELFQALGGSKFLPTIMSIEKKKESTYRENT